MDKQASNMENRNIKKLVNFSKREWEAIEDYRFNNRIDKQVEAIRDLIRLGLEYRSNKIINAVHETFVENAPALKDLANK